MDTPAIISDQAKTRREDVLVPVRAGRSDMLDGAEALHMMGRAAFACATQTAGGAVVMAKADSIEFIRPVRAGAIADIRARVVFKGRSSMTVIVEIAPDDANVRRTAPAVTGRFLMIAVDGGGTPRPIPTHTA